jgi:hypothetical protein
MPAHPQEAWIGPDVGNDRRLVGRRNAAGDTLPERHARPADLEAVEPVGRGERQVRSIPVKEVQRGDVRVQRVAGPVDHGLEQLVPRPRGRGERATSCRKRSCWSWFAAADDKPRISLPSGDEPGEWVRVRWARWDVRSATATTIQA